MVGNYSHYLLAPLFFLFPLRVVDQPYKASLWQPKTHFKGNQVGREKGSNRFCCFFCI